MSEIYQEFLISLTLCFIVIVICYYGLHGYKWYKILHQNNLKFILCVRPRRHDLNTVIVTEVIKNNIVTIVHGRSIYEAFKNLRKELR